MQESNLASLREQLKLEIKNAIKEPIASLIEKIGPLPHSCKLNIQSRKHAVDKLLIDLGHLAISANILKFDKYDFLKKVIDNFSDKIFEVHISENDFKSDLHNRVHKDSWQLEALGLFKKLNNFEKIYFAMESRGMSISEIKYDLNLIAEKLY